MTGQHTHDVAAALRQAATALIDGKVGRDVDATVVSLITMAVETVPGATAAGISRYERDVVESTHGTNDLVARLDELQSELQQGPCVTAAVEQPADGVVYARDLRGQSERDRWPAFAPQAADMGFRSLLSIALHTGPGRYGALNIYAEQPDAFDEEARLIASLFGAEAGALLYSAENVAGVNRALQSRDLIGQAKGILMGRHGIDAEAAFRQLVEASQHTNMKLTAVAEWLTADVARHASADLRTHLTPESHDATVARPG